MKKLGLSLFMLFLSIAGIAQNIGEAFYIYRNDGQFNAFFRDEVDSIAYSYFDADSIFYEEIVMQVVYTADSVYRIPLAAIDSVSFVTPETKYSPDAVQLSGNLFDYVVSVDGMNVTLSHETPASIIPKIGDKLAAMELSDKFPLGFVGKVAQISANDDGLTLHCDSIEVEEVVTQFYGVAELVSSQDGNVRRYIRRKTPKPSFPIDMTIPRVHVPIELSGFITKKKVFDIDGCADMDVYIKPYITGKVVMVIDKYLGISVFNIHADTDIETLTEIDIAGTANKDLKKELIGGDFPMPWGYPLYIELGPKLELKGELAAGFSLTANFHHSIDITYYPLTTSLTTITPAVNFFNSVSAYPKSSSLNMNWKYLAARGSIKGGMYLRIGVPFGKHEIGWVGGEFEGGAKIDLDFMFDFERLKLADRNTLLYDEIKDLCKLEIRPFVSAHCVASVKDDKYQFKVGKDIDMLSKPWYSGRLIPSFSNTKMERTDYYTATVSTEISHACPLPYTVGFSVFDSNNDNVGTLYNQEKYGWTNKYPSYQLVFNNLRGGSNYKVYPVVKLFGYDMLASPSAEIEIEAPITLDVEDIEATTATAFGKIEGLDNLGDDVRYGIGCAIEGESGWEGFDAMEEYGSGYFSVDLIGLKPNTNYIYFAYLYIDGKYIYGEEKKFTTTSKNEDGELEAYCVLENDTLTFYNDSHKNDRVGKRCFEIKESYNRDCRPDWNNRYYIYYYVFDSSFSSFFPTNTAYWFSGHSIQGIVNMNYLNTSNVTNMSGMFSDCVIQNLDETSIDGITNLNTTNVTDMSYMFCGSRIDNLDLRNLNTSNVTDMSWMFYGCRVDNLDLSNLNTSNVTDMSYMFYECRVDDLDISNLNTSNVTDMSHMFEGCRVDNLDVSSFNTSNVTDMSRMFDGCSSLKSLDLRSFNTANVTDMHEMFGSCESLTSLDLRSFNTAKVTNMQGMFACLKSLRSIDLSSFNTAKVTNMNNMFSGCSSLTTLDLSTFKTTMTTQIKRIFEDCQSIKTIYVCDWNCNYPGSWDPEFKNCHSLTGGKGTKIGWNLYGYNTDGTPLYYYCSDTADAARIDGGKDNPGLFTAK